MQSITLYPVENKTNQKIFFPLTFTIQRSLFSLALISSLSYSTFKAILTNTKQQANNKKNLPERPMPDE